MLDVVGADDLVVIANTGDDIEIYGAYVSPDPDLVTFWLADRIDERGWGLDGDTFARDGRAARAGRRRLVQPRRPRPGDRHRARAARSTDGRAPDRGPGARSPPRSASARAVLPMSDRPVRTRVLAGDRWWPLQEFMIRHRGEGPIAGRRLPRRPRRAAHARGARGDRRPRGRSSSDRPTRSSRSARSSPLPGSREASARSPGARRRGQPARRRRGAQGPDRGVPALGRAPARAATGSPPSTRG